MMVTIEKVKKSFPGLSNPVLNGLDLSVSQGDFCVLVGANGCGKSTLLKLISGEYGADSGDIKLDGDVAQVTQDVNLGVVSEMTLLENIALSGIEKPRLSFYRRYRSHAIDKLKELDRGLEAYIDQPLKMLSGGQRQVIATLIAMNLGRKILLLDEHTSALDPKMQHFLMEYTARQVEKLKLTAIMVTHKMDDAIKYGHRLIMLHQGNLVLDIQGAQKQALTIEDLLVFFHRFEDQILSGGEDDH